jgi:hypothetical protein
MTDTLVAPERSHAIELELGNVEALGPNRSLVDHGGAPAVTRIVIPEQYTFDPHVDVDSLRAHIEHAALYTDAITQRPDDEALMAALHIPGGAWFHHSKQKPSWVHSDTHPEFAEIVSRYHGIALGRPDDVEDTHWTRFGPPGSGPQFSDPRIPDLRMLVTNSGLDLISRALGGATVGATGTSTATSSTSMTDSGASWTSNAYAGQRVQCGTAYAMIKSNTATVLTVDRWYTPSNPGGSAASTPGATTAYMILDGNAPAWFVAMTSTNITPAAGDTALSGEITTASSGFLRKIATYAHTAAASTFTITVVDTATASDSFPTTLYAIGVFASMVVNATPFMLAESSLNASATVNAVNDQVTVTETVTV